MVKAEIVTLPETAMVTLWCRASEARRPDGIIDDPVAIRLVDSIDYDFSKFSLAARQDVALRALAFDGNAHRYLSDHPQATVVALGEGLQTSFWRLDASGLGDEFRWLTVDLPAIIDLRLQLLPHSPRISTSARSVLDFTWMDQVNPQDGVFITAEGLLPYLQPDDALSVIRECARRFPRGQIMFDLPSKFQAFLARRRIWTTLRGGWPRTPFALSAREAAGLADRVRGVRAAHNLPVARGRGPVIDQMLWPTVATLTLLEFDS